MYIGGSFGGDGNIHTSDVLVPKRIKQDLEPAGQ